MNTKIRSWIDRHYAQIVVALGLATIVCSVMFWHQIAFLQVTLTVIASLFGCVYYLQRH